MAHSYFEVDKALARLDRLAEVVQVYKGPNSNTLPQTGKDNVLENYDTDQEDQGLAILMNEIQASREELKNGLTDIGAFCMRGWPIFILSGTP